MFFIYFFISFPPFSENGNLDISPGYTLRMTKL